MGEGEDSSDSACTGHSSFVKRARAENRARPLYPLCFLAFFRTADDCLYEAHHQNITQSKAAHVERFAAAQSACMCADSQGCHCHCHHHRPWA